MEFEWDITKEALNEKKHGIAFHEAATLFGDPLAITFSDPDHSIEENRFIAFGESRFGRLIVVAYTERSGKTRIISARQMTKQEKRIYEEG